MARPQCPRRPPRPLREHRRTPVRVAVLGDATWQKVAQKLASRFLQAESCFFDAAHAEQARIWAAGKAVAAI